MNTDKKQLTSTKPTSRVKKPKYDNIQNSAAYVCITNDNQTGSTSNVGNLRAA